MLRTGWQWLQLNALAFRGSKEFCGAGVSNHVRCRKRIELRIQVDEDARTNSVGLRIPIDEQLAQSIPAGVPLIAVYLFLFVLTLNPKLHED